LLSHKKYTGIIGVRKGMQSFAIPLAPSKSTGIKTMPKMAKKWFLKKTCRLKSKSAKKMKIKK